MTRISIAIDALGRREATTVGSAAQRAFASLAAPVPPAARR